MNKYHAVLFLAVMSNTALAASNCFTVFGPDNAVTYRSRQSPVDLSLPISAAMGEKYPGSHLVWTRDDEPCKEVDGLSAQSRALQGDRLFRANGSALFATAQEGHAGDAPAAAAPLAPGRRIAAAGSGGTELGARPFTQANGSFAAGRTRVAADQSGSR